MEKKLLVQSILMLPIEVAILQINMLASIFGEEYRDALCNELFYNYHFIASM